MQGLVLKIRAWWNIADRTAKTVTVVGVSLLLLALVVIFTIASQPDYVVLYADLNVSDAGKVINKLKDLKVPFRIGGDGATIEVAKSQKDEVRMKLAAEGLPGESSGIGKGWLDKSSLGRTQEQEKTVTRVMLEEELQKTIESLDPVQSARVHLTTGDEGPFADQVVKPSADVVLHMKSGANIGPDQVQGVVNIVSRSVSGLGPKDVSVVDGQGRVLFDGTSEVGGGAGIYAIKRREEHAYAKTIQDTISRHLDVVLGPGKSLVSVDCQMNFDTKQSDEITNTPSGKARPTPTVPANTISETSSAETYANGAGGPSGPTGASANVPGANSTIPTTTGSGSARSYQDTKTAREYAFDQTRSNTIQAPGKVEKLNVAVLVDASVDQPTQDAIQNYLNGVVGIPATGDPPAGTMVTLAKTKFDQKSAEDAAKAATANASKAQFDKYLGLAPALALIIAAFLVMRALGKQTIRVQAPTGMLAAAGAGGGGMLAGSLPADLSPVPMSQAQSMTENLPPAPEVVERKIEVAPIPEKFDLAYEQIVRMVEQKPSTVAVLIKSWMMEDRN